MDYVGIDVHKKESQICIIADGGELIERRVRTEPGRFAEVFERRPLARILLEASTESEWVARCLEGLGHEVVVADPSFAPMYAARRRTVYYAYRRGGFQALFPRARADRGRSRAIAAELAEQILRVKRERPRRSIRRIIRMLERARIVRVGALHRSTVHRLLAAHGASARPLRGPVTERRSFLPEHAGDLWVGDALHGPPVIAPDGTVRQAYLLSQIDGATRYVPHSYFAVSESAVDEEYGFQQAIAKHGPPRTYYVDRGPACIAHSLRLICAELGIRLLHTGVQDCEAKGVIERWHRTWREEVGDELPDPPLPLAELNATHWARLAAAYHARPHVIHGLVDMA
jgi:transposase InsO family protein